jgi:hypothetical protein
MEPTLAASLSPDLVPFLFDALASVVLVKILGVQIAASASPGVESGTLRVEIVRVLRGRELTNGGVLEIPFARIADAEARDHNRSNQWNALDLSQGVLLLLALERAGPSVAFRSVAGVRVSAPSDPNVGETAGALEIEALDPARREQPMREAILQGKDILRRYAIEAVGVRGVVPRPVAVEMIAAALADPQRPPDDRLELGILLARTPLFDAASGADATNVLVVSVLAQGLVEDRDADRRSTWLALLASRVLSDFDDDEQASEWKRRSLIHGITRPTRDEIVRALNTQAQRGDPADQPLAKDLLREWKKAGKAPLMPPR